MKTILTIVFILFTLSTYSQKHVHKERYYQNKYSEILTEKGLINKLEVTLIDKTRCDIVTSEYAIEVDFANKWAQSVGQTLHYSYILYKKPAILLIMERNKDFIYLNRLMRITNKLKIKLITIDLNLNIIEY